MKSGNDFGNKEEWLEYLRTYFAGLAMQGLMSVMFSEEALKTFSRMATIGNDEPLKTAMARISVGASDELIKELNKEGI